MTGIQEIATATGLSKSTVSRALRDLPSVAPSTISTVRRVADELGYIPSSAASGLATGRNHAVGVVVPVIDRWFYVQVLEGVDAALRRAGYDLILFNLGGVAGDRERVFHRSILRKRVDALILLSLVFEDVEREQLQLTEYPMIVIGGPAHGVRHLGIDDHGIGRRATEYLLDHGHRRIAHVGGQDVAGMNVHVPGERYDGFVEALASAGIDARPEWNVNGAFSFAGGYEAGRRLLSFDDRPTAVFAASDEMAFGVMHALREAGLRIPEDVSVVGIDGHAYGEVLGLTTFAQDPAAQGAHATEMLLSELAGHAPVTELPHAPVRFIERHSVAAPREGD